MFSRTRIFNNPAALSSAPSLYSPQWFLGEPPENATLQQLFLNTIPDTKINREISFWNEPVLISFAYISAYTILGDGVKVLCDDLNVKSTIMEFNDQVNVGMQSIDDVFCDVYIDNIIHAGYPGAFWRVLETDEQSTGIDIARLDPLTLTKKKNKEQGYEVLIQAARKDSKSFYSRNAYNNYWKEKAFEVVNIGEIVDDSHWETYTDDEKFEYVVVPNETKYVLEFDFFRRPPMSAILNQAAYKRWIVWFMKQYAERMWSKFKVGYVGNPQFYMPDSEEEFKKERDSLMQALMNMKNFGAMATPGYNKVEELGRDSAKSSEFFIESANFLNEEMMFSMMGSMGIRSAKGSELATGRILEHGYVRGMKGIQGRFDRILKNFYVARLLPVNKQKATRNSIELRHSPMMLDSIDKTVKAVRDACECLVFDDWNEPRQILQSVFGAVVDEVAPERAKEMREKFIEMNSRGISAFGKPAQGQPAASAKQPPTNNA